MSRYILGLYWGPRGESVEECALRLQVFFDVIQDLGPAFSQWGEKGWTRKEAMKKKVDPNDLPALTRIVEEGIHRNDVDGEPIEGLGFTFGLWNMQKDEKGLSLIVRCGMPEASPGLEENCVNLEFSNTLISSLDVDVVVEVLSAGAKAWKPRWGGVFSVDYMLEQESDLENPLVEWLLYLDRDFATVGDIEPPSRVVSVNDIGTIVVVQDTPPDTGSDVYKKAASAIKRSLQV